MKLLLIYLLIVGLSLTGMSTIYQLTPIVYTQEDNQFAGEYAGQMAALLIAMQQQSASLSQVTKPTACDYFLSGQDRFYEEKYVAIHFKRDLAEDFVYALVLAEDWCRHAARAAYNPQDTESARLAEIRYQKAYQQLQAIRSRDYCQLNGRR